MEIIVIIKIQERMIKMENSGQIIMMIVIYALIFVALYFFLIRPNSKKKKQEAEIRNNLTIGDDITTIGGIVGRVIAIKDEEEAIVIETGPDRTKMKFKKWCISTVDTEKTIAAASETAKDKEVKDSEEKKGFFGRKKKNVDESK